MAGLGIGGVTILFTAPHKRSSLQFFVEEGGGGGFGVL
jgi:hypothetical protein